jgi:hypothetical protein
MIEDPEPRPVRGGTFPKHHRKRIVALPYQASGTMKMLWILAAFGFLCLAGATLWLAATFGWFTAGNHHTKEYMEWTAWLTQQLKARLSSGT